MLVQQPTSWSDSFLVESVEGAVGFQHYDVDDGGDNAKEIDMLETAFGHYVAQMKKNVVIGHPFFRRRTGKLKEIEG